MTKRIKSTNPAESQDVISRRRTRASRISGNDSQQTSSALLSSSKTSANFSTHFQATSIQPSINQLPSEILLMILSLLPPDSVKGLALVCRRWRDLIYGISSFWTTIRIYPWKPIPEDQNLPRLNFLIERAGTGSTPLHVNWRFESGLNFLRWSDEVALSQTFMERIPFSRVQSLEADEWPIASDDEISLEYFQGPQVLQKLTISEFWKSFGLLKVLNEANVRVSALHIEEGSFKYVNKDGFKRLLDGVSALTVSDSIPVYFRTNPNITTFSIEVLPCVSWHMSQLRTLHVTTLLDLDRLTLATVPLLETLHIECIEDGGELNIITFPCLRSLTIASGELWPLSFFKASKLDILCVNMPGSNLKKATGIITRLLSEPTYTLSPTTLYLNLPLEIGYIAWFLRRSPRVRHLFVAIDAKIQSNMKEFVKEISLHRQCVQDEKAVQKWHLCPDLTTLYLRLSWAQSDTLHWKSLAEKIMKGRSTGALEKVTCEWSDGNVISVTRKELNEIGK